jgi:site-specific DNA recombinase
MLSLTAAYARVSSDRQEKDQTIDSQLEALHRGAAERNLRLTEDLIFVDNGFSGARLDRPGLDRLRDQASEGTCTTLLVRAPDRLARHFAYQAILLEEHGRRVPCSARGLRGDLPQPRLRRQPGTADAAPDARRVRRI